jgi:hypothetical protein
LALSSALSARFLKGHCDALFTSPPLALLYRNGLLVDRITEVRVLDPYFHM